MSEAALGNGASVPADVVVRLCLARGGPRVCPAKDENDDRADQLDERHQRRGDEAVERSGDAATLFGAGRGMAGVPVSRLGSRSSTARSVLRSCSVEMRQLSARFGFVLSRRRGVIEAEHLPEPVAWNEDAPADPDARDVPGADGCKGEAAADAEHLGGLLDGEDGRQVIVQCHDTFSLIS
jgi:hypothetical protein